MSLFREQVRKLLSEYKVLMKKYLPSNRRALHFRSLGVDRYTLKYAKDVVLFQAAHNVLADLNKRIATVEQSGSWFSGLDEFRQVLNQLLEQYRVEDNAIIHATQVASTAMIRAIQLMTMQPTDEEIKTKYTELDKLSRLIYQYGSKEQKQVFVKALRKQSQEYPNLFLSLLDRFEVKYQQAEMRQQEVV